MRARFVNEFHKTGDPLKSLNLGMDAALRGEDQKHDWYWNYDYEGAPKTRIIDIVNYYRIYIKILDVMHGSKHKYVSVCDPMYVDLGPGEDCEEPPYYNDPQTAANNLIEWFKVSYDDYDLELDLNIEPYSIAGVITVPEKYLIKDES